MFQCYRCNKSFVRKDYLIAHLQRKTICLPFHPSQDIPCEDLLRKLEEQSKQNKKFNCKFCNKAFTSLNGKYQHQRTYCKQRKSDAIESDEKTSTGLLEKMKEMNEQMQELKRNYDELKKLNNRKENTTIHVNGHQFNNCNFVIQDFGNESLGYIQNDVPFLTKCLNNLKDDGMKKLVERIHYDPEHPENNNARIKSTRNEVCEVFQNDAWNTLDKNETLDKMIEKGYKVLSTFYHTNENIKDNDMNENDCRMFFLLCKLGKKEKNVYCPIRKKVYALMLSKRHGVILEGSSNINIDDPNVTLVEDAEENQNE